MNLIALTYTPEDLARARAAGDATAGPASVAYTWWLEGPEGAGYALLREPSHTDSAIQQAKRWLVNNHDVVRMHVYKPEKA